MTCKEFQINNTFNEDDKKFIEFVKVAKFKQCPKCRYWVEKNMVIFHNLHRAVTTCLVVVATNFATNVVASTANVNA